MTYVRKRCAKCGRVGRYRSGQRRCRLLEENFRRKYMCWGDLMSIGRKVVEMISKRPQDIAAQKLAHARAQVTAKTKALKRLATSLRFWENKASYFAKRASMTDEELAAQKEARLAK